MITTFIVAVTVTIVLSVAMWNDKTMNTAVNYDHYVPVIYSNNSKLYL